MKIKNIAAICKKRKRVKLFKKYNSDGDLLAQYISDGAAAYPVCGLPELDEEGVLTIFDVPEIDREKWYVECDPIPDGINLTDTDENESPVKNSNFSIVFDGKILKPISTRRGMIFIDSRYLSPLADVLDVLELYERATPSGTPYIAAKAGLLLQAAIMPRNVINADFVEQLQELARQCAVSLDLREREQAQAVGEPEKDIFDIIDEMVGNGGEAGEA